MIFTKMPSPKSHRRGHDDRNQNRRGGRLSERSSSFHGQSPMAATSQMRRPKTLPDLLGHGSSRNSLGGATAIALPSDGLPKLTKLLLNVTMQGSVGAVQVVIPPESTVNDLVAAAVRQYTKEGRRPILPTTDASKFDLHYSQFCLESKKSEKNFELIYFT